MRQEKINSTLKFSPPARLIPFIKLYKTFIIKEYKAINSREQEREIQQALILDLNIRLVISHPPLL